MRVVVVAENRIKHLLTRLDSSIGDSLCEIFPRTTARVLLVMALPPRLRGKKGIEFKNRPLKSAENVTGAGTYVPVSERQPITASMIASESGLAASQVSRELAKLESKGIVTGTRGKVPPGGGRPPREYSISTSMFEALVRILLEMQESKKRAS
jgi:predicted transcriptional regulator